MSQTRKSPVAAGLKRILKTLAHYSTHIELVSLCCLYAFDGILVGHLFAGVLR